MNFLKSVFFFFVLSCSICFAQTKGVDELPANFPFRLKSPAIPPQETGKIYEKIVLPNGTFFESAMTRPHAGGKGLGLVGKGIDGDVKERDIAYLEDLPAQIAMDAGLIFHGTNPLKNMIIASRPTPLRAWREADENLNRNFRSLCREPFFEGAVLVLPEGFVGFAMGENFDQTGLELPLPIGSRRFGIIHGPHFYSPVGGRSPWNRGSRIRVSQPIMDQSMFREIEPDPSLTLVSIFPPHRPLLSNRFGSMKQVYVDVAPRNRYFALVKTSKGWLAGFLLDLPDPQSTALTHEAILDSEPVKNYRIRKKGERRYISGRQLFSTIHSRNARDFAFGETPIESMKLSPADLLEITETGLESTLKRIAAPAEWFPRVLVNGESRTPAERGFVTGRDVNFQAIRPGGFILEEEVERSTKKLLHRLKRNRRPELYEEEEEVVKERREVVLPRESDGTVCLTNGESIFLLKEDERGISVTEYEVRAASSRR